MSTGEKVIAEVPLALFVSEEGKWRSVDGGSSLVYIYHDDTFDRYRTVGRASTKEFVLNAWIKKDAKFSRLNDQFAIFKTPNVDFGMQFGSKEWADVFCNAFEISVNSLRLKEGLQGISFNTPEQESSLPSGSPSLDFLKDVPIPPPVSSSPTPPSLLTAVQEDLRSRSNSNDPRAPPARMLRRGESLSAADLSKTMSRSIRLKKKDKDEKANKMFDKNTLSLGSRASLANIINNFEETAIQIIVSANECVLNPAVAISTLNIDKAAEMLQMILIIIKKPTFSPVIMKMMDSLINYLNNVPKGKIEQATVEASNGLAYKLVKSTLIKKIHSELASVRTMQIQTTCIVEYISAVDPEHTTMVQLFGTVRAFVMALTKLNDAITTLKYIETIGKHRRSSAAPSVLFDDVQVWEEKTDLIDLPQNKEEIRVGNLNQLIVKLTSDSSYDNKFLKTFVATYQSFAEPWTLLEKLKQRFNVPETFERSKATQIQLRVGIVLKYWVETQLDDFDEDLILQLRDFISSLAKTDSLKKISESLLNYLDEQINKREARMQLWFQTPESVEIPEGGICLSDLFMELPAQQIAEQLTLIDFDIYKSIEHTELLNQSWNKNSLKHRSPNVIAMIVRSTRLSHWVALMILSQDDLTIRAKMIEKMIDIANALRNLNNFNTLMGLIAGLNMSSIHRLKATYKKVSSAKLDLFKKIEKSMDPEGSFSNYRKLLAQTTGPSLPYLGVYLTDLTFMEDGNPNMMSGMINWKKRDLLIETILRIQQHQQTSYQIDVVEPIYTFLQELPFVEDNDLYDLSQFLEPKSSRDKKEKKEKKEKS